MYYDKQTLFLGIFILCILVTISLWEIYKGLFFNKIFVCKFVGVCECMLHYKHFKYLASSVPNQMR